VSVERGTRGTDVVSFAFSPVFLILLLGVLAGGWSRICFGQRPTGSRRKDVSNEMQAAARKGPRPLMRMIHEGKPG
jgi:hypothetical protein